mmetsp:Transcript_6245/g.17427  ORF Transcript_6245/g.17427 Transcript_6245/m.17427 type:complete len:268 (-) Transcript_6245:275-1078(-)
MCGEAGFVESQVDLIVRVLRKGIHIEAHGAREEGRVLRDDGNRASTHVTEPEASEVNPVDRDRTTRKLPEPEKSSRDRGLASPGAPADAHVLAGLNTEAQALQRGRQVLAVAHHDLVKGHGSLRGPRRVGGRPGRLDIGLLIELGVVNDALHARHLRLGERAQGDKVVETRGEVEAPQHGKADQARGNGLPTEPGSHRDCKGHDRAEELESHAEPAVRADERVDGTGVAVDLVFATRAETKLLLESPQSRQTIKRLAKLALDRAAAR